ncbi:hypothetical protein BDN71DRAFT_1512598 [Pleurotus eryngii]|uniref:Uncharacterized protein n=1 Tax=Pleurotus eryngii TaxID=5323 RepID=A0A9P5ZKW6_PLEER|nr:hypothetical protein BDN71DRAFT_1512598 [Pleurotus eryngii]
MSNSTGDIPIDPASTPTGSSTITDTVKHREPLLLACSQLGLKVTKKANLEKLRAALVHYW